MAACTASSHVSSGALGSSTAMLFCKVQLFGTWLCAPGAVLQEGCSSDFSNVTSKKLSHCCLTAFALA